MLKQQEVKALNGPVRLWLEKRGIPLQDYCNLPSHCKDSLRAAVCGETPPPSDRQLRDLAQKLHLSELREKGYPTGAAHLMQHDQLKECFSLTADEWREYLSKY